MDPQNGWLYWREIKFGPTCRAQQKSRTSHCIRIQQCRSRGLLHRMNSDDGREDLSEVGGAGGDQSACDSSRFRLLWSRSDAGGSRAIFAAMTSQRREPLAQYRFTGHPVFRASAPINRIEHNVVTLALHPVAHADVLSQKKPYRKLPNVNSIDPTLIENPIVNPVDSPLDRLGLRLGLRRREKRRGSRWGFRLG